MARTAPVGPTHAVCATTGATVCGIEAEALSVLDEDWEAACFVEKCADCFTAVLARGSGLTPRAGGGPALYGWRPIVAGWRTGVWLGPGSPPGLQRGRPGLLLGQQLLGELADRRHAASLSLRGGNLAAGAIPCRHDLDEGEIERSSPQVRELLQVAAA